MSQSLEPHEALPGAVGTVVTEALRRDLGLVGLMFCVGAGLYFLGRWEGHLDTQRLRSTYSWNLHRLVRYCLPTDSQIR